MGGETASEVAAGGDRGSVLVAPEHRMEAVTGATHATGTTGPGAGPGPRAAATARQHQHSRRPSRAGPWHVAHTPGPAVGTVRPSTLHPTGRDTLLHLRLLARASRRRQVGGCAGMTPGARSPRAVVAIEQERTRRPAHEPALAVAGCGLAVRDLTGHPRHLASHGERFAELRRSHGLGLHLQRAPGPVATPQGGVDGEVHRRVEDQ